MNATSPSDANALPDCISFEVHSPSNVGCQYRATRVAFLKIATAKLSTRFVEIVSNVTPLSKGLYFHKSPAPLTRLILNTFKILTPRAPLMNTHHQISKST